MDVIAVYKCLCDRQRLRILNLLARGPLCVCHLVEILEADQVKMSKQLRYLKEQGMVEGERVAQWMIYRLTAADNPLVRENLKCLQDCFADDLQFAADLRLREAVVARACADNPPCASALQATA